MMKNFKEMLDKDLERTFYNTNEFAEIRKICYDGVEKKIPVVFDSDESKERSIIASDHAEGIHTDITVVRIKLEDLRKEPRQRARFFIDDELYTVLGCRNEYNELIIELERFDE